MAIYEITSLTLVMSPPTRHSERSEECLNATSLRVRLRREAQPAVACLGGFMRGLVSDKAR